jgi:hypothetical protein
MITEQEYNAALELVRNYKNQLKQEKLKKKAHLTNSCLKRGDYVRYIGGSNSKHLIKGNIYRLTCEPFNDRVCIIAENGKRMNKKQNNFELK